MLAAVIRTDMSLSLRVAASVAGIDLEFGRTTADGRFQRVDILSAMGGEEIVEKFGGHIGVPMAGRQFKEANSKLLSRPKLESSKVTD